MSNQWRLFLAALRFVTPRLAASAKPGALPHEATRFVPLVGSVVGLLGAGAYWLAAEIWPTSIAVVVSLLATALVTADLERSLPEGQAADAAFEIRPARFGALYWVFVLFIKYNALMALSAASLPYALPAYLNLGLIMVAGHAASFALAVSVMAADVPMQKKTSNDLTALVVGLAPATALGIPGLIGLVTAIVMRLGLTTYILPRLRFGFRERLDITRQMTESCFYLGALATWKYV